MRISDITRRTLSGYVAALAALVSFSATGAAADDHAAAEGTYEWSAKLVAFDSASSTAVFRARIESYADIAGLAGFSDGDRLTLVWTGRNWAAGVRDLVRGSVSTAGALTLPVEFVATDADDRFLDFRVAVPAASRDKIEAMAAGTRVTGVSPRTSAAWGGGILTLRHYNEAER